MSMNSEQIRQAANKMRLLLEQLMKTGETYYVLQLQIDEATGISEEIGDESAAEDKILHQHSLRMGIAREITELANRNFEEIVANYIERLDELAQAAR